MEIQDEDMFVSKFPEAAHEYINDSIRTLYRLSSKHLFSLTESILRNKAFKSDDEVVVVSVPLNHVYFDKNILLCLIYNVHYTNESCTCSKCQHHDFDQDEDMLVSTFHIVIKINGGHGITNHVSNCSCAHGEHIHSSYIFLTHNINKILLKLSDEKIRHDILSFFILNYPFDICISCKKTFKDCDSGLCYKCELNSHSINCSICLDEDIKLLCVKLECGHIFHYKCWDTWVCSGMDNNNKCPLCKSTLTDMSKLQVI